MTIAFEPQLTADGSYTFISPDFAEAYHSHFGAQQEAFGKFVQPCQIAAHVRETGAIRILDICYGLGYNSAAALTTIAQANPDAKIELVALDLDRRPAQAAIAHQLLDAYPLVVQEQLTALVQTGEVRRDRLQARFLPGDARHTLARLEPGQFLADAIFLDPFSPPNCPQLWTVDFIALVARYLAPTGTLATYSCAAAVRSALLSAGLHIGSSPAVGRKAPGTIARWYESNLPPLSRQEQEHLQTRAAIPYRDRDLSQTAAAIQAQRATEQAASDLEPTSRWKRRWFKS
jgi:tRNA U34 5-methylaminomethyl-2-thiouridine-forming methyltransferase MnmC